MRRSYFAIKKIFINFYQKSIYIERKICYNDSRTKSFAL